MAKYRKKPVVIEAVKWDGKDFVPITEFMHNLYGVSGENLTISTMEGVMIANPGDWIIKGVKGEFYPCKPDIFEATYEAVEG